MGKFADGVMKFRLKAQDVAEQRFRKVVLDLDTKIVERTPVDTGAARARWQPNVGPEPIGGAGSDIGAFVPQLKLGDTAWISNNLPYIRVLEYGLFPNPPKHGAGKTVDGYSTQAPQGMIRITAVEFSDIVEQA